MLMVASVLMSFTQSDKVVTERMNTVLYGNVYNSSYIKFDTYVTRESIVDQYYQYKYEIVVVNTSKSNSSNVTIYMTGINVFANNVNVSYQQYPSGFWSLIPSSTNTVVYWYKTNDPYVQFHYTWTNIQFY